MALLLQVSDTQLETLCNVADQFSSHGSIIDIQELGNGNVNDTFLVTLDGGRDQYFVLQRINTQVFCQPERVMQNILTFSEHVDRKLHQDDLRFDNRRWEVPRVLRAQGSQNPWVDAEGSFWRAMSFIGASESFDTIKDIDHAREIGYGLGMFHTLISDLPVSSLADTLEGFHITPSYLAHYHQVLENSSVDHTSEVEYCVAFVRDRPTLPHVLETAKADGKLQMRPIHGDPKINNVLMDSTTGQAIGLIDLDTVKPGLVHYDIGDCLRSGCNLLGEETQQWEAVTFEPDLCEAILQGYGSVANAFLTEADYDYFYDAIRLIAFELGLRFLTDYLAGNVYFKSKYPSHNLDRALVQFKLTESIEAQASTIRAIIRDMR